MNTINPATQALLCEAIRVAFNGVRRGTITLHEALVIDNYGSTEQRNAARQIDTERAWQHIPDDQLSDTYSALTHLDPVSWRFYLPAYMIFAVRRGLTHPSAASERTVFSLRPHPCDPHRRRYAFKRYETLNETQALAVHDFLNVISHQDEHEVEARVAAEALVMYWIPRLHGKPPTA